MIFLKEELSGEINKKISKEALCQRRLSMAQGFLYFIIKERQND